MNMESKEQKQSGIGTKSPVLPFSKVAMIAGVYYLAALLTGAGVLAGLNSFIYKGQFAQASALLEKARSAADQGDYTDTFLWADMLTSEYPDFEQSQQALALKPIWEKERQVQQEWRRIVQLAEKGEHQDAVFSAKDFLSRNPDSRESSEARMKLQLWENIVRMKKVSALMLAAQQAKDQGNPDKALEQIATVLEMDPAHPQALALQQEIQREKEALRIAAEQKAKVQSLMASAAALEKKEEWQQALAVYQEALAIRLDQPDTRLMQDLNGRMEACQKALSAVKARQVAAEELLTRARQAESAGHLQQAVEYYRQAASYTDQSFESQITSLQERISAQQSVPAPETPSPAGPNDPVVVTVDGVPVYESQVQERMNLYRPAQFSQVSSEWTALQERMKKTVLDALVSEQLLAQKIREHGIMVSAEEVDNKIADTLRAQNQTREDLLALLSGRGLTMEQFTRQIEKALAYEKLLTLELTESVAVSESEASQYYSEYPDQFRTAPQVRASHILIKVEPSASEQQKSEARGRMYALLAQLRAGADFADLARKHSECPSAAQGGDLGFFGRGQMVQSFEDEAFRLEVGRISEVVETSFGYHLIRVTDRKEEKTTTFTDVKEDIIRVLREEKLKAAAIGYLESLKQKAVIVYPNP
jgi:peptidyl-prolyl cis-trans isomerase C